MTSGVTSNTYTAFLGERAIAAGPLNEVVSQVKGAIDEEDLSQILIFENLTSRLVEVDFRGTSDAVLARLRDHTETDTSDGQVDREPPRQVGRPKLGVVSGEVTLLPRHWEWLKSQPGGASVTLRRLVDEARHVRERQDKVRNAQEVTYRFMTAVAGDFAHYEEALRSLYAGDARRFDASMDGWAPDIRDHIQKLATKAFSVNDADN